MNIINRPAVWLVSRPTFAPHPLYVLPPHTGTAENIIATAGKVCYDSYGPDGRSVPDHIKGLVSSGHGSVLEHAHVGVFIEGISRACSHEIVRHRMFNYSQRSTRYTEEGGASIVLEPFYARLWDKDPMDRTKDEAELISGALNSAARDLETYERQVALLEGMAPIGLHPRDRRKWCRGKARQWLPHALETRMVMTGNLRSWRHFFLMRTSRQAEAEIRRLAELLYATIVPIAPAVFADLHMQVVDGFAEVREKNDFGSVAAEAVKP